MFLTFFFHYTIFPSVIQETLSIKKEILRSKMKDDASPSYFRTRMNASASPEIALPFYAHNTGILELKQGQTDHSGGILNPFVRVSWILSGQCETLISDRSVLVGPNTVFYTLFHEERRIRCISKNCRIRWFCFDGPLAEAFLLGFRYPRLLTAGPYPESLFGELDRIMTDDTPACIRRKSCLIMEILCAVAPEEDWLRQTEKIVPQSLALIHRNLSNADFGLETLCEYFHISPATLTRLFRKHTQISPGRYILNMRLSKALSLLTGTDLSVERIAGQCGFRDRSSFTRFIRRSRGCSPTEYRKRQEQKYSSAPGSGRSGDLTDF